MKAPFENNSAARPSYIGVRALLLRGLGIVYLAAFWSLLVQIDGLAGAEGIIPAGHLMDFWADQYETGAAAIRAHPTLFWWWSGSLPLVSACWIGIALSITLIVGVGPRYMLLGLWLAYLSLVTVVQPFLAFQWDLLLLEVGFVAVLFAPAGVGWRVWRKPVDRVALWALRLVFFRLYFLSGLVKLSSADGSWQALSALDVHFWTQPLPTWTSVWAHHMPHWIHALSVVVTLLIQIVVPFLIFAPRRFRLWSLVPVVGLQALIAATGNYGFFNLLTVVLCLALLDDQALSRVAGRWIGRFIQTVPTGRICERGFGRWTTGMAAFVILLGGIHLHRAISDDEGLADWEQRLVRTFRPLRLVNSYGLFASMTQDRIELELEGSRDGESWERYGFHWKPGDVLSRPGFQQPHMPRLDWQMWFAPLAPPDHGRNEWFFRFAERLLLGSSPVADLLAQNPFAEAPPQLLRVSVWRYRFSSHAERRETGAWWQREYLGLWCPLLKLESQRIVAYRPEL